MLCAREIQPTTLADAHEEGVNRMAHNAALLLAQKSFKNRSAEVSDDITVAEGMRLLGEKGQGSLVLYNEEKAVVGIITSRDVLRSLVMGSDVGDPQEPAALAQEMPERLARPLLELVTPVETMVFAKASDSLARCQIIMSERRIRNLPVVDDGAIVGLVTAKDLMDYTFEPEELGGKASFIKNIATRSGLPAGVRVKLDEQESSSKIAEDARRGDHFFFSMFRNRVAGAKSARATEPITPGISVRVAAKMLPHPFKLADGYCANSLREYGPGEFASDPRLSDDAYFVIDQLACPHQHGDAVTVVGVADGVGEWRLKGYNSGAFSHNLMQAAKESVENFASSVQASVKRGTALSEQHPIRPLDVLKAAWKETLEHRIPGSATALVATLDTELNQLSFSNVGDAGIVVLRHIDSTVAGYMRERTTPRHLRQSDLRVAFQSQQQLKAFNLPYQLGYFPGEEEGKTRFETPRHADTTSFPVLPGDTIIIATDGLFDNVELDELCAATLAWEKKHFGGEKKRDLAKSGATLNEVPEQVMQELAKDFCSLARKHAVDDQRDGPFAMLAKENDIMWSGGMPDDITVVVMRVLKGPGFSSMDAP